MLLPSDADSLIERARAAGCQVTVGPGGMINIKPAKNLPPELRSEVAAHKFSILQHLYSHLYRAYFWADQAEPVLALLKQAREQGASVSLKTLDGETTDLLAPEAVGAYVRPGRLGIPEALIPALIAAGFERVEYAESWVWATSWAQAAFDLIDAWRTSDRLSQQAAVWLVIDAGDAVTRFGLEPWEGVEKTYRGIEQNLPQYGRERALLPVMRRWWQANQQRDALRAADKWLAPTPKGLEGDYAGLVLTQEAEKVLAECERWAWLVVAVERLAGNWPWVDPTGWVGALEGLLEEVAA